MLLYNFRSEATEEHQRWLVQIALTFCREIQGVCLIAHDSRPASRAVACAIMQEGTRDSVPLLYLGQWSTPAIAFACRRQEQQAIVVTASHNAWEQVGLKLLNQEGLPLSPVAEDALALQCFADASTRSALSHASTLLPSHLPALDEYVHLLALAAKLLLERNMAIEVGQAWRQAVQHWLPGIEIRGAMRTDPSSEPPEQTASDLLFRLDEDLDKLVVWAHGREIPGQMLLVHWVLLRPEGTVCLSFDVTLFAQRFLEQRGYTIVTTPVGDQFVAHAMVEHDALTGGEPNGHYIAAERSFCPDALACSLDLLAGGGLHLFASWHLPGAQYHRGILSPFPYFLEEVAQRLIMLPALHAFHFSFPPNTFALVAQWEEQRIILRLSRFEQVAVIQTEGQDAQHLFSVLIAHFPESSIHRRESWTE